MSNGVRNRAVPALASMMIVLAAGCASIPGEPCCAWAGIDARTLLGRDGVDCGVIKSHPLEPRAQQLRCARDAARRGIPYMIAYRDTSAPYSEALEVAIFSAQGEKILLRRPAEGAHGQSFVGTCTQMSVESDGRIRRAECTARADPVKG
jgi:hypothetical protein